MKKIGIICEYNPFHNGHIYHINKIKKMFPDSTIVAVMSGNFTQRGHISLLNKEEKTNIVLKYGIDLVVELPFVFATQSADIFAKAAVSILEELKVDYLVFGSESNNVEELISLAKLQINNETYNNIVKKYLDEGINYPTAMSKALKDLNGNNINTPNDLLGLSYIKAILEQNSNIIPLTIKRTNDFHSNILDNKIVSATAIREAIDNKIEIKDFVPNEVENLLKQKIKYEYFQLLKYKIITEQKDINKYLTVDEGIENRILKYINEVNSIEELIEKIKTKRYTYNKISRMLLHILCSLTKEQALENKNIKFIRILGFNKKGQKLLNKVKKDTTVPLIVNPKYYKKLLILDNKIDNIYKLITEKQ